MKNQKNIFKWKKFEKEIITLCVRWYCSYHLTYRNLVEMMEERGLSMAHTTIMRWVHQYSPEIKKKLQPFLRKTNKEWKVDEVMIKVKGEWVYLYRAVDSNGKTLDFMVSERRNKVAAKKFFKKILKAHSNQRPKEIVSDKHLAYPPAVKALKKKKIFSKFTKLKRNKYLNNLLEQDHRFIKKIIKKCLGFFSLETAKKTIAGIEAIHMIRKGQTRRTLTSGKDRAKFIDCLLGVA